MLGEICEHADLFLLGPAILPQRVRTRIGSGRRVDDVSQEVAYELQRPFVALYEIRLATYRDREYEGRLHLVGTRCSDDQVVDRVVRSLLKRDAYHAAFVAKFGGAVTDEEVREVAHCDLPLERHPAAAGRVRTCRVRGRAVLSVARTLLVVGAFHRQISSRVITIMPRRSRVHGCGLEASVRYGDARSFDEDSRNLQCGLGLSLRRFGIRSRFNRPELIDVILRQTVFDGAGDHQRLQCAWPPAGSVGGNAARALDSRLITTSTVASGTRGSTLVVQRALRAVDPEQNPFNAVAVISATLDGTCLSHCC